MFNKKKEDKSLRDCIDFKRLPKHIAVIMDGNGRWAKSHSFPRIRGHHHGVRAVKETVTALSELGVKVLTLYSFSEENWQRPKSEVKALMAILKNYLVKERNELIENDIRLKAIGNLSRLPKNVIIELKKSMEMTKDNKGMILNLALSYSGRDEIIRAVNRVIKDCVNGKSGVQIDQKGFSEYLDTNGLPDPDLLIRTSGEQRISNYMLWQLAYTEIYVTDVLWPDFGRTDLYKAIIEFQKRERRFGLVSEQLPNNNFIDVNY